MAKNRAQRRAAQGGSASTDDELQDQGQQSATSQWIYDQKASNLESGTSGWTPSRVDVEMPEIPSNDFNPQLQRIHNAWGWAKLVSWIFIVGSAIAMIVVMWIPELSLLTIGIVSVIFFLSVLSLFIVQSPRDVNPNLDSNGTAV